MLVVGGRDPPATRRRPLVTAYQVNRGMALGAVDHVIHSRGMLMFDAATYRNNYDRLAQIKAKYDPKNFFRVNQSIRPDAGAEGSD